MQYRAKAPLEGSQPQKSIASILESNEIINLFLDLTPQATEESLLRRTPETMMPDMVSEE